MSTESTIPRSTRLTQQPFVLLHGSTTALRAASTAAVVIGGRCSFIANP